MAPEGPTSVLGRALLMGAIAVVACSSPKPAADPVIKVGDEPGMPTDLLRYLPLQDGTVFSYETGTDNGEKGILVLEVSRPRPGRADLKVGGRTERLQIESLGIAYVEGGYLLKSPLTQGATWRSKIGTAKVETMTESITVPAGKFDGCVRTVEESHEPGASKVVRSVYCPHVGLVSLDVEGTSDTGHEHQVVVLRSFGPRVDITKVDVTTTTAAD